jgi:hypothetical protein
LLLLKGKLTLLSSLAWYRFITRHYLSLSSVHANWGLCKLPRACRIRILWDNSIPFQLFCPLGIHVLLLLLFLLAQVTNLLLPVIYRLLHCLAHLIFSCQLQLVLQHAYQRELSVDLQLKSRFQWWFLMRCTSVVFHNLFFYFHFISFTYFMGPAI